jgi:hypothetical protein
MHTQVSSKPLEPRTSSFSLAVPDFSPKGSQIAVERLIEADDSLRDRPFDIIK